MSEMRGDCAGCYADDVRLYTTPSGPRCDECRDDLKALATAREEGRREVASGMLWTLKRIEGHEDDMACGYCGSRDRHEDDCVVAPAIARMQAILMPVEEVKSDV